MSGRPIDHIVLAGRSLNSLSETYEGLGFTLTPRAQHNDMMGTSNRLVQFAEKNFIELLEVDRPDCLLPHDFDVSPPVFSFGAHLKDAVSKRDGISMIVFQSEDARADIARWEVAGVPTFQPFDFGRKAAMPDGSFRDVSFSLGFASLNFSQP